MLLCLTVFFAVAEEGAAYTGTLAEAESKLLEVDNEQTLARKRKKLDAVTEYIKTVDPSTAGLAEFNVRLDNKEFELAYSILLGFRDKTEANARSAAFDDLAAFLVNHPFGDGVTVNVGNNTVTRDDFLLLFGSESSTTVKAFLGEAAAIENAVDRHKKLDGLRAYCIKHSVTLTGEDAESEKALNFKTASEYLASVTAEPGGDGKLTAQLGATVRLLDLFEKEHALPTEGEEIAAYRLELNEKRAAFEAKRNESIVNLAKGAHVYDYSDDAPFDLDFDDADVGNLKDEGNSMVDGVYKTRIGKEKGSDGENTYYTVHYDKAEAFSLSMTVTSVEYSMVFELDVTTFSELPKAAVNCTDKASANGTSWDVKYFSILPNGDIASGLSTDTVLVSNAVTPGEWTHITVVLDFQDNVMKLYVDYQLVEERSTSKNSYYYAPSTLKLGAAPSGAGKEGGEFSIDNVRLYSGFAPRDIRTMSKLTDLAKLTLYTERFNDTAVSMAARLEFYEAAKSIASTMKDNPEAAAALAAFNAITADEVSVIEKQVKDANRDKYIEYVGTLERIDKGEATNSKRNYWLSRTESYLASLSGKYTEDTRFLAAKDTVSRVRNELDYERVASEFTTYVNAFYSASSIDDQTAKKALAEETYKFLSFKYLSDKDAFPAFNAALAKYPNMDNTLNDNIKVENSKKLYSLLYYVSSYDTEESWVANYEFLKNYVTLARGIINEGNYDAYYNGIDEMLDGFLLMNAYFYDRIQGEFLAYIQSEMARFDASGDYFEKYGIAVMIKRFVAENEVDAERPEMAALLAKNEENLAKLTAEVGTYEELLVKNAAIFTEKCAALVGSIDYLTMKKLVAEASVYFYNMNVNDAVAQDALAVYIARRNEIIAMEAYAAEFLTSVAAISASETDDERFAAMIVAGQYINNVEKNVDGVNTAIAALEAEMAAYNASVAGINDEIKEIANAAAYLSNLNGRDSFLTAILARLLKWGA